MTEAAPDQYEAERERALRMRADGYMTAQEYKHRLLMINRAEARAERKRNAALAKAEAKKRAEKVRRVSKKLLRRALHRSLSRYEDHVPDGLS